MTVPKLRKLLLQTRTMRMKKRIPRKKIDN